MANESMKPDGLLEAAAKLIDRALDQLDVKYKEVCAHCHNQTPRDHAQFRVHDNLRDVPRRLRRGSAILRGIED